MHDGQTVAVERLLSQENFAILRCMACPFIFSSHSLNHLIQQLSEHLSGENPFSRPLIVTESPAAKEWIQIEVCKQIESQALLGLEFAIWEQVAQKKGGIPDKKAILAAIWLLLEQKKPEECLSFLTTEKKKLDLMHHLADLFFDRILFDAALPEMWQEAFFEEMMAFREWKPLKEALEQKVPDKRPLYLFSIDFLPLSLHRYFWRHPSLKVFRFSPCALFWEDIRSTRERKHLLKHKDKAAFEDLLRDTHPLLANWSLVGRKMLAHELNEEYESDENYTLEEQQPTILNYLQQDLLSLEKPTSVRTTDPLDRSISLFKAGFSLSREVEILRDQILLCRGQGIDFSQMRVYAPKIELYAPLIEMIFSHPKHPIPYRIARNDLAYQSSFYQGLKKIFSLVTSTWEKKEVCDLFTNSAFCRKIGWKKKEIDFLEEWLVANGDFLDSFIWLHPQQESFCAWSQVDFFESFFTTFHSLRKKLLEWKKERTLSEWLKEFQELCSSFLVFDEDLEADRSMQKSLSHFFKALEHLSELFLTEVFPFAFVEGFLTPELLEEKPILHGIRCASLKKGEVFPARALFFLGMDEESFPRKEQSGKIFMKQPQWDRYLFLQAIFAAKENLMFSFCHRSKEDGKEVAASLLIQELFDYLDAFFSSGGYQSAPLLETSENKKLTSSLFSSPLIKGFSTDPWPATVTVQELNRFLRHPFQYYLEQVLGIALKKELFSGWEEFELSPLLEHSILERFLIKEEATPPRFPIGAFKEVATQSLQVKKEKYLSFLNEWQIDPCSIYSLSLQEVGQTPPLKVSVGPQQTTLLLGKVSLACPKGVLFMGEDSIKGILRRWPEVLAGLLSNGSSCIYFLRSGKKREVSLPLEALQSIVSLFFSCRNTPLFFHPDWADALLKKETVPDKELSEDKGLNWILEKSPLLDLKQEFLDWQKILKSSLGSLIALFPVKGSHAEV